jgi:hypothetical protein
MPKMKKFLNVLIGDWSILWDKEIGLRGKTLSLVVLVVLRSLRLAFFALVVYGIYLVIRGAIIYLRMTS